MSRESILERNRKRAQENDQKMGATALGTSALNYSTQQSLERAAAEKVARESAGGLVDVPQPWLDTITPVTPSSRSARRWSGTTPSSRGGGFGETESQGRGYFSQADYSFLDRANDVIQGGLRQWAGGVGSAAGNVLDRTTSRYNSDAAGQWLDLVQDSMENRDDESYFERPEVQDRLENIRETREQTAPFVQEIYEIAEETGRQGTEQIERAKADLGPVGSFAVDVGTQVPQMLADAAFGAVTGGSALLPLGVRSYGSGVQEAMEAGANRDQAAAYGVARGAVDTATEKIFNVALPFARLYGGGSLDDVVERGVRSAVERFASTEAGRRALGGGLTLGASALTEGAEEFIADWASWQMPRIYGGDVASAEETLSDSLYDFLVGAAVGGLGGVVSPSTYNYQSGTTSDSSNPARQAMEMLAQGQEISGSQATRIARDPEALSLLQELTGQEINTDAPISQVRSNIQAVAAARRGTAPIQTQTQENTQAQAGTAPAASQEERTAAQQVYDVNRMQRAASALGESGRRALNAAYDGSTDAERFYGGFAAYYEAGVSGRSQESVRSEYAGELNEAQRYAAYTAGQNDAAASLAREQAAAQYAPVAGEDSGLVYDDFVRQAVESGQSAEGQDAPYLTQETAERINSVAKALGLRVRFADSVRGGTANASIQGSEVLVERNNPNPVMFLLGHEWTHRLQETAPTEYRAFREFVAEEVQGEARVLLDTYRAQGEEITYEAALDEAAANYAGRMIEDGQVLDDFIQKHRQDRTLLEKIRDAIRALVRKLTGAEKKAAQTAEGKLSAALEAAERQVERNAQNQREDEDNVSETKYSLKNDSETLEKLQSENDRLNRRIQELSRQVAELKRTSEFSSFEDEIRNAQDGELDGIVARYTEWEEASGLTDANRELEDLNRQARDVRRNLERARAEAARQAREEYRELYNEEFAKKYASKAARKFGTTSRFDLAGYLTVNGSLLDFSDRQGYRVRDHREIAGVLDFLPEYAEYSDGMIEFMNLGNIRMQSYGIDISRAPNSKQRSVLRRFFNSLDGEVTVDFSRQDGGTDGSIDYPEGTRADRILNDIDHYFSTGVVPEQSMVSQFHTRYSLKVDSQGRELTAEQREFFRDSKAVDNQGRLLVLYHGTAANFTVFDAGRISQNYAVGGDLGFYFTPYQEDARGYAGNAAGRPGDGHTMEVYLNLTNPLVVEDDGWGGAAGQADVRHNDLSRWAKNGGHDGIIVRSTDVEMGDGEYDTVYIAFYPEQIKRVDNASPTTDPDIRFSRKGSENAADIAALQEENARLRERVNYWKGQTRRTTPGEVDQKAVNRAARELIRDFDATIDASDISGDLLSLYNYMGTGREGNSELTYTEARRRANDIARKIVESAETTDNSVYQAYGELRDYLRNTQLTVSPEIADSISDYGAFRRQNFGRLNLSRGSSTNIDQVYVEMSELWPEFFDEVRESNPTDQLLHIAEVAEQLYQATASNPFMGYYDQAVSGVSNEILERFFDIPQVRSTFADRADQRVEAERQRGRERVQKAIRRERQTRARQLERLKNRYQARDRAGRERRSARELRARISRHVGDLSRRLLRPSDKQHIPEQLRTAVAGMLDSINLESVYVVDPETGKRRKGGEGNPTKRTEAFRALRQAYAEITKEGADYTLIIDPDLMDNLDQVAAMRDTPLAEMSVEQLTTVWDTVKAVEASVRTANKMLGQSRFQTISQVADGLRNDNILRQDRGDFRGVLGRVDKLVNMDMLTPQSYFHRLGKTGDSIFQMLRSAQDRQIEIMRDAETATRDIVGKTDINKLERETHTFQVEGGTVTLSTAQIMSLYELMKRQQAQEHIFTGGIRPETIPGQRGIRESRRSAPVRVTAENLAEIVGTLTDEQVEMADKLQQYMGGRLSELGNEASMEVYGYRKFTEDHYFPIQVDRNQTQRDISKEAQAQTIAGRGFTKGTVPRANNAVMLNSIFDVYSAHVNDMATYAAWLSTMENVRRIRDFTFRDSEGNRTGTVKDIIERVFGRNGNPYLNKLVDDLNQGVRSTADPGLMDRIVGNYKAASVSANLRVILQQPTAILRALNTLDAKYLLAGTVKRGDWQKVKQYAPIAQWKDWGYFDINTGRQMKDVLFDSDTRLERLRQAGMAGASAADSFTWARLWNAVEAETKDRRKDLKPGTKEFYQAVGQRFSEIVDQTQVVDGVLQRSHIMRSPDGLTKMTTSFMGEPTKSYNMFLNAVYDLRHATGKESRRTARRALARTSVALAVSFTINAVMQSLVDGLRDDDKELDYWERVQRAFIGFSGDEESFLDYWNSFWSGNLEASYNPLSYMPYFKDLVSIIQGYDVSRMDAEALEKVFTSGKNFWQALNGEGRYSLAGASASFLAELSRLFGLPVANLKRDIQGTVTSAAIETDDYWLQYQIDKALLNIGYSGNRSGFMDILYAASVNDPEAYELIYDDMTSSGITQEQIRTSMETRMREAQGVESVADLTRRYLTPDQERTYNRIYSQVTSSAIWSAASAEQRESVEEDLYALASGTEAGLKLQEKIDAGASYGVSNGDYLLYLAAREIADAANENPEKRNGSIDQSEAEAAIDMLTGLSNEAKAYLWQSTNKGWSEKNNPYR